MRRRLHDRLLYIVCSQNWEAIGSHYWIKQCIELLLVTAIGHTPIKMSHESSILPSVTSVVVHGDKQKKEEFQTYTQQESWWNLLETVEVKEEVVDMDLSVSQTEAGSQEEKTPASRAETITKMINKHYEFIEVSRNVSTDQFLVAASQLCHMDTNLAEQVWLALFPRLWAILEEEQRSFLTGEILPFLTSGSHIVQKDCHPSAINTFVEALCRCNPPIQLAPYVFINSILYTTEELIIYVFL